MNFVDSEFAMLNERLAVHYGIEGVKGHEALRPVEVYSSGRIPSPFYLRFSVVDTPGLNALDEYHETVAREFIEEADAVVWLFSATQGGTATEAGILAELREGGRKVLGVLNKVDTLDSEADRDELTAYLREPCGGNVIMLTEHYAPAADSALAA